MKRTITLAKVLSIPGLTEARLRGLREQVKNNGRVLFLGATGEPTLIADLMVRPSGAKAYQFVLRTDSADDMRLMEDAIREGRAFISTKLG